MKSLHSPNDIEVVLHYYCSCKKHPREDAPSVEDSIRGFIANGILEVDTTTDSSGYRVTEKGKAWIKMFLDTPYPVQSYKDPRFLTQ